MPKPVRTAESLRKFLGKSGVKGARTFAMWAFGDLAARLEGGREVKFTNELIREGTRKGVTKDTFNELFSLLTAAGVIERVGYAGWTVRAGAALRTPPKERQAPRFAAAMERLYRYWGKPNPPVSLAELERFLDAAEKEGDDLFGGQK